MASSGDIGGNHLGADIRGGRRSEAFLMVTSSLDGGSRVQELHIGGFVGGFKLPLTSSRRAGGSCCVFGEGDIVPVILGTDCLDCLDPRVMQSVIRVLWQYFAVTLLVQTGPAPWLRKEG